MAILAKLAKTLTLAAKATAAEASHTPGFVKGHFARNPLGGEHFVRDFIRRAPMVSRMPKVAQVGRELAASKKALNAAKGRLSAATKPRAKESAMRDVADYQRGVDFNEGRQRTAKLMARVNINRGGKKARTEAGLVTVIKGTPHTGGVKIPPRPATKMDHLEARREKIRAMQVADKNRFRPNPLGPGYLTRNERYNELLRSIERKKK